MAPTATDPPIASGPNSKLSMPLISLAPIISTSPKTRQTAESILSAFRTYGFCYVTDFSSVVPPSLLSSVFDKSAKFFTRPQSQKDSLEWAGPRSNRGYSCIGREKASHGLTKEEVAKDRVGGGEDLKESFEMSREGKEGYPNRWPDGIDEEGVEFKSTMLRFYEKCKLVHAFILRAIAIGMGLEADFFEDYVKVGDNTLRLLHYPVVPAGGFDARIRAGAHTDFGSVTLLFQDQRGGLQVEKPGGGKWLDVQPVEGTMVVNAGDLLARWSNDLIRSTKHRVVEPPSSVAESERGHPARYSVVYFGNPDFDKWIDALPGTWEGEKGGKKYEGINAGDYVAQRLSAIYGADRE